VSDGIENDNKVIQCRIKQERNNGKQSIPTGGRKTQRAQMKRK